VSSLLSYWPIFVAIAVPLMQAAAAAHVVLRRRDVRASAGWMGLIWLAPVVGVVLYSLFGVNRIKRRARSLRRTQAGYGQQIPGLNSSPADLREHLGERWRHLQRLAPLGDRVTGRPLLASCSIAPLVNGEEAYPAMLEAIAGARTSVSLLTYIFDADRAGNLFRDALKKAVQRGVEVRVLIDAVGARYSVPRMAASLRRAEVRVAHFMPPGFPWRTRYVNLRNHRKILVIDGSLAFTGGMNIREQFWPDSPLDRSATDLHFRVEGPVVAEIQEVFADDWTFSTGERLEGDEWFPVLTAAGACVARGISDGPDINYEKLQLVLLGALSVARSSVRIITPYFLPDQQLISALNVAAMRGVDVEVIVPDNNNQALVQWASTAQLEQLLERGVRVYASPTPFDHSKLMLVDVCWILLGSANWDPRSLQLNFEFNVEAYDPRLAVELAEFFDERRAAACEITLEAVRGRPLPVKLRDGVARLFSPYL
jgi:cardiolipin synthase